MDYATITAEVTEYDHEDARKLRSAVRKWADSFTDAEERMAIWSDGWKEGFEVSRKKRTGKSVSREKSVGRTVTSKGTNGSTESDLVVNVIGSGYSREMKENSHDRVERDGSNDRRKVQHVSGMGDACSVIWNGTNDKRVVENWKKHDYSRRRSRSAESNERDRRDRKQQFQNCSESVKDNRGIGETRRGNKNRESKERTSKDKDNEKSVSRGQTTYDRKEKESDRKRKENSNSKSKGEGREDRYSREIRSETERPREESRKEKEAESNELCQNKETESDKANSKGNDNETDKRTTADKTEAMEISYEPKTNSSVKRKNIENTISETPAKAQRIEDEFDNYVDNIELTEEIVDKSNELEEIHRDEKEKETAGSSSSFSSSADSSSSGSSSSSDILPTIDSKSLRARAITILSRGAMPLCPPARRIWSRTLQMEMKDGKIISWPPSNWRALSPELRLFAMEQMALTLERGSSEEFPKLPKKLLVDKYMFLMLEGQEKPLPGQTEEEKVPDKIRQYNLNFLRGIVRGDINDSRQSWSIIKTLERADRWTDTDEIVDFLETKNIKIKL